MPSDYVGNFMLVYGVWNIYDVFYTIDTISSIIHHHPRGYMGSEISEISPITIRFIWGTVGIILKVINIDIIILHMAFL